MVDQDGFKPTSNLLWGGCSIVELLVYIGSLRRARTSKLQIQSLVTLPICLRGNMASSLRFERRLFIFRVWWLTNSSKRKFGRSDRIWTHIVLFWRQLCCRYTTLLFGTPWKIRTPISRLEGACPIHWTNEVEWPSQAVLSCRPLVFQTSALTVWATGGFDWRGNKESDLDQLVNSQPLYH